MSYKEFVIKGIYFNFLLDGYVQFSELQTYLIRQNVYNGDFNIRKELKKLKEEGFIELFQLPGYIDEYDCKPVPSLKVYKIKNGNYQSMKNEALKEIEKIYDF